MLAMRTANVVAVGVVVAALATGCGAKRVDSVTTLEGVDAGRRVRVEGTLLLVGSTPFTTSALAIDSTFPGADRARGLIDNTRR